MTIEHVLVGGQILIGVHEPEVCRNEFCCIHNMSDHHMRDWEQNWRPDKRMMERICRHGLGHPDPDDPKSKDKSLSIHACDGCCTI